MKTIPQMFEAWFQELVETASAKAGRKLEPKKCPTDRTEVHRHLTRSELGLYKTLCKELGLTPKPQRTTTDARAQP